MAGKGMPPTNQTRELDIGLPRKWGGLGGLQLTARAN